MRRRARVDRDSDMMKAAKCPMCGVVHEATGHWALDGADEKRAYRITHCRLCNTPSETFLEMPDQPDVADDDLGFPLAVVPWLAVEFATTADASGTRQPVGGGPARKRGPLASIPDAHRHQSESPRLKATRLLLGGPRLFKHKTETRLDVHRALVKGIPFACLLAFVDRLTFRDVATVMESLCGGTDSLRAWRRKPSSVMPIETASRAWLLAETFAHASDVLGDLVEAEVWMVERALGLKGHTPLDLLWTVQGTEMVHDFLVRLEDGV